jgi:hypothetical protein
MATRSDRSIPAGSVQPVMAPRPPTSTGRARGVTVAALALPSAMAYAELTGRSPVEAFPRVVGWPPRTIPSTLASGEPAAWLPLDDFGSEPPSLLMRVSPSKKTADPRRGRARPAVAGGGLERLVHELEGTALMRTPRTEGHDHPEQPPLIGNASATVPPSTSEEPAGMPRRKTRPSAFGGPRAGAHGVDTAGVVGGAGSSACRRRSIQ